MANIEIFNIKQVKYYNWKLLISYLNIRYKINIKAFKRKIGEEFSIIDLTAKQYICSVEKKIGTARIMYKANVAEFGRLAIIKEYRKQGGYGSEFINQIIIDIKNSNRVKAISLNAADRDLTEFYKWFGFVENGEVYFNNIPYTNMVKSF